MHAFEDLEVHLFNDALLLRAGAGVMVEFGWTRLSPRGRFLNMKTLFPSRFPKFPRQTISASAPMNLAYADGSDEYKMYVALGHVYTTRGPVPLLEHELIELIFQSTPNIMNKDKAASAIRSLLNPRPGVDPIIKLLSGHIIPTKSFGLIPAR